MEKYKVDLKEMWEKSLQNFRLLNSFGYEKRD